MRSQTWVARGAAALFFAVSCTKAMASGPWDGVWYYDAQHSSSRGILQLSLQPDGKWTMFNGSSELPFVVDGQLHRRGSSAEESRASQPDPKTLVIATSVHGRQDDTITLSLSADGRTLTSTHKPLQWNGTESQRSKMFARTTPGESFQGTWKLVPEASKPQTESAQPPTTKPSPQPSWVIWTDTDGTMTWFIPNTGETLRGKADSKPRLDQGPLFDEQFFTWERTSPTRLLFTALIDGKPVEYAAEMISPDGQTFTEALWAPGHEDSQEIRVFKRQP